MNGTPTPPRPADAVRRLHHRQLPVNPTVSAWRSADGSLHASANCPSLHSGNPIEIPFATWVETDEDAGRCACGGWTLLAAADTLRHASAGLAIHDAVRAGHSCESWRELVDWLRLELTTLRLDEHVRSFDTIERARITAFKTETTLCVTQLIENARAHLAERPLQAAIAAQGVIVPIRAGLANLFDTWGRQQLGELIHSATPRTAATHPALFENALEAALARKDQRFLLIHEPSCAADGTSDPTGALVAYTASRVWGSPLGQLQLLILPAGVADGLLAVVGRRRWIAECAELPDAHAAELAIQLWEPNSNGALAALDTALQTAASLT